MMSELVIRSVKFKYEPKDEIMKLLKDFNEMVNFIIKKALELKVTSLASIHHATYKEMKINYPEYNTQYFISAIKVAFSIIKSAKKKGKEPVAKRLFIKFNPNLTKFYGDKIRISLKPREFIEIPLTIGDYQKRFIEEWKQGRLKIGEIIINSEYVIIPFKTEINFLEPDKSVALDVNEQSVVAVDSEGKAHIFDLSEAKRLHHTYFEKRREIQDKFSPKTARKVIQKAKGRERNRVRDLVHKVSRAIVDTFRGYRIIMEDLKGIREHIKHGKKMNRRLYSWNFRLLQSFVDYKAKLNQSPIVYLNPRGSSKNCSRCGGIIAPKGKFCSSCGIDRHINACINLLKMWGSQPTLIGSPMI